jgi:hypothetical protein
MWKNEVIMNFRKTYLRLVCLLSLFVKNELGSCDLHSLYVSVNPCY